MLNALLVGLFFRADQFIIKASAGRQEPGMTPEQLEKASTLEVERYQAAYSFLNFVLLITPAVTLALFPRMARHAATDRPRLAYEYAFALKVLLVLSVPIVVLTVWFAPLLVSVLTGFKPEYLPASAVALQILIFFLPFSFINGVTQYVLIALDLQRLITRAFAATVVFNLKSPAPIDLFASADYAAYIFDTEAARTASALPAAAPAPKAKALPKAGGRVSGPGRPEDF